MIYVDAKMWDKKCSKVVERAISKARFLQTQRKQEKYVLEVIMTLVSKVHKKTLIYTV